MYGIVALEHIYEGCYSDQLSKRNNKINYKSLRHLNM